ncbi:MAG: ferric reductase-like transmembrane domain-containing protein [Acidimicrobiia bacterium]
MLIATITSHLAWYLARTGGLVAWGALSASVVWGLSLSTRVIQRKGMPAWLLDLHRFLATLALAFTALHLVALWADNYLYFGARELFVPMSSAWRPGAVTWGVLTMYGMAAIQLTSWTMRHLPRKFWHLVHLTSLPLFVAATVHGFQSGTDKTNVVVQWVCLTGITFVLFLLLFRLTAPRRASGRNRSRRQETDQRTSSPVAV